MKQAIKGFFNRAVGEASPATLGAIRILICGIILISILWEDLASTAMIPPNFRYDMGVLKLVRDGVPGFDAFMASAPALMAFKALTALLVLLALLGWRTRIVLPFATICFLIFGGILRQYCHFYHTGLSPLFLLGVLCFVPCADSLSLDCRRRRLKGLRVPAPHEPQRAYSWSRYAVWITMAIPYAAAGFAKLRISGFAWCDAHNMKSIVLRDSINMMQFDFGMWRYIADAPDAFYFGLAVCGMSSEVLYGLVLVLPLARRVLPVLAVGLHIGILLMQNILFFDLILLQLMFLESTTVARLLGWLGMIRKKSAVASWARATRNTVTDGASCAMSRVWVPSILPITAVVLTVAVGAVSWVRKTEYYPFTMWQMYAGRSTRPSIGYYAVVGRYKSGEVVRVNLDDAIGALSDSRYRDLLWMAFNQRYVAKYRSFIEICGRELSRQADPDDALMDIEVQYWIWNISADSAFASESRKIKSRHVYRCPPPAPLQLFPLPEAEADLKYEYEAGWATQRTGDHTTAIVYLDRVYAVRPKYGMLLFLRGFSLQKLNRTAEAIECYRLDLESRPWNYQTHFNLGWALVDIGESEEALVHLKRTLELKPDYVEVYHRMATALIQLGRWQESKHYLDLYKRLKR